MRRGWIVVVGCLAVGCGAPAGSVDEAPREWQFELSADATVLEPDPVPRAARTELLRPELDLTIGPAEGGEPPFFAALDLAVDADGSIYVQDAGAQNIKVFDADGAPLAVIGAPGEGPGELSPATPALAVAGERVVLSDAILGRFTLWHRDGTLADTVVPAAGELVAGQTEDLAGLSDGTFVVAYETPTVDTGRLLRFIRLDPAGELLVEYPTVPVEYTRALVAGRPGILPVVRGRGHMALSPAGELYLTPGDEYQILALTAAGEPRWALRSAWPRAPFPDDDIDRAFDAVLGQMRAMGMEAEADHDSVENLPDELPALSAIKVDGRGRLWVFPYEYWNPGEPDSLGADRPVDVYDANGTRLFTGLMPASFALAAGQGSSWVVAAGDHVYGVEIDPDSFEQRLVRYRLDTPF